MRQFLFILGTLFFVSVTAYAQHGKNLDVNSTLNARVRVGKIAAGGSSSSRTGIDYMFSPSLQLVRSSPRATSDIKYQLNLLSGWAGDDKQSINLLHSLGAQHRMAVSRRLNWQNSLNISLGEVDYSRSLFLFNANDKAPSSRPEQSVIRFVSLFASTGFTQSLSRKQDLNVNVGYVGRRDLGDAEQSTMTVDDEPATSFPSSHGIRLTASLASTISLRARLTSAVETGYTTYSSGQRYVHVEPSETWSRTLRRNTSLVLQGGGMLLMEHPRPKVTSGAKSNTAVFPTGSVSLSTAPNWKTITRWTFQFKTDVRGYFNPVDATVTPRLGVGISVVSQMSPHLRVQTEASAASEITKQKRVDSTLENTSSAAGAAKISLVYDIKPKNVQFSSGIEARTNATYPFSKKIDFSQEELTVFIGLLLMLDDEN